LSTALYQHDAAVRVIARVTRERDEAREALAKVGIAGGNAGGEGEGMEVDGGGALPDNVAVRVDQAQERFVGFSRRSWLLGMQLTMYRLSKTRRKRPVPEDWATEEAIQTYQPIETTEQLYPGGKSLGLNASGELALVGGSDGIVGVYSLRHKKLVSTLKGGGGAITDAIWAGNKAVIATSNGVVKVFEGGAESASFNTHAGSATALALHPDGEIVASVGVDKSYVIYDLEGSFVAAQVFTDSGTSISSPLPTVY
jgi:pre-mRNA-processing factor 19